MKSLPLIEQILSTKLIAEKKLVSIWYGQKAHNIGFNRPFCDVVSCIKRGCNALNCRAHELNFCNRFHRSIYPFYLLKWTRPMYVWTLQKKSISGRRGVLFKMHAHKILVEQHFPSDLVVCNIKPMFAQMLLHVKLASINRLVGSIVRAAEEQKRNATCLIKIGNFNQIISEKWSTFVISRRERCVFFVALRFACVFDDWSYQSGVDSRETSHASGRFNMERRNNCLWLDAQNTQPSQSIWLCDDQ